MAWDRFRPGGELYEQQMRQNGALTGGIMHLPLPLEQFVPPGEQVSVPEGGHQDEPPVKKSGEVEQSKAEEAKTSPSTMMDLAAQIGAEYDAKNAPAQEQGSIIPSTSATAMMMNPGAKNQPDLVSQTPVERTVASQEGTAPVVDTSWGPGLKFIYDEYARQQQELADQQAENERRQRGLRANQYVAGLGDILASIANLSYVGKGAKKGGLGARNQVQTYGLPLQTERIWQDRRLRQQQEETMKNRLNNTRLQMIRALTESDKQESLNSRANLNAYIREKQIANQTRRLDQQERAQKYKEEVYDPWNFSIREGNLAVSQTNAAKKGTKSSGGDKTLTYAQRVDRMKANVSGLISAIQAKEGNGSAAGIADNELRRLVKEAREGKKSAVEALISIYGRQYADWWREYGVDEWGGSGGSSSSGGSSGGSSSGRASSGGGLGLSWGQSAEEEETAGGLGLGWGKN